MHPTKKSASRLLSNPFTKKLAVESGPAVALSAFVLTFILSGCGGSGNTGGSTPNQDHPIAKTMVTVPTPEELRKPIPFDGMIGSDRRMAVVFECYYALRQDWINPPHASGPFGGNQINGAVVGDWPYITTDTNALNHVIGRIGRHNASESSADLASSGYAMQGGYERMGQCLFATVLLLRRSLSYDLPVSWASYNSTVSARNAQPGDVVYYKNYPGSGQNHIGIVVLKNGDGIDVIDSNYVGHGQSAYRITSTSWSSEILGRHWVSNSQIDTQGWKVYSGAGRWY